MNSIVSALTSVAHFSDEGDKRYLLGKSWNSKQPSLAIIMMCPSTASVVTMDSTTLLCTNNAERLGYGSIAIVNLFATLNDFDLKEAEDEDPENLKTIADACQAADAVVYAPGVGKAKNKSFQRRQEQVLTALRPMEDKLYCICAENGSARLQHPLSPSVRQWHLSKLSISELIQTPKNSASAKKETVAKTKGRPRGVTTKEKTAKADTAANEIIILSTSDKQSQTSDNAET